MLIYYSNKDEQFGGDWCCNNCDDCRDTGLLYRTMGGNDPAFNKAPSYQGLLNSKKLVTLPRLAVCLLARIED